MMEPRDIDVPTGEVLTWLAGLVAAGRMSEVTRCPAGDVEYVVDCEGGVVIVTVPGALMLEWLAARHRKGNGDG